MKSKLTRNSEKNITEENRTLGSLLRRPYQILQERVYGELAATGFPEIRPAHSSVFRHILPSGSRVTDLAEAAQMTKQSMAYLVESLKASGYVEIAPDPTDGRAKIARLTEKGRAAQQAALAISRKVEEGLGTREEILQLRTLLARLNDRLGDF
jgi:DNA-binding MarR family transcriptional regulator